MKVKFSWWASIDISLAFMFLDFKQFKRMLFITVCLRIILMYTIDYGVLLRFQSRWSIIIKMCHSIVKNYYLNCHLHLTQRFAWDWMTFLARKSWRGSTWVRSYFAEVRLRHCFFQFSKFPNLVILYCDITWLLILIKVKISLTYSLPVGAGGLCCFYFLSHY